MFEKRRDRRIAERVAALQRIPLLGESILLATGATVQKPNPMLVRALSVIDPRLKYFPTNLVAAEKAGHGYEYYGGVTGVLGKQVRADFPITSPRTVQRGTVLSLRDRFMHYDLQEARHDIRKWSFNVDPEDHREMNDVLTVLATGSERKGLLTSHFDGMGDSDKLGIRASEWLFQHTMLEIDQCLNGENADYVNNLFPTLLVYDVNKIDRDADARIKDPDGLKAIYVTDRILYENQMQRIGALVMSTN